MPSLRAQRTLTSCARCLNLLVVPLTGGSHPSGWCLSRQGSVHRKRNVESCAEDSHWRRAWHLARPEHVRIIQLVSQRTSHAVEFFSWWRGYHPRRGHVVVGAVQEESDVLLPTQHGTVDDHRRVCCGVHGAFGFTPRPTRKRNANKRTSQGVIPFSPVALPF
jgi:hypothetical protein